MTDMNEKKEVASHKWADRVAIALLICLLVVLLITGLSVYKAYGAEDKPAINVVLQFGTADGEILKGLVAHYLKADYSMEIRDNAKYTVIILNHKESIYLGIMTGAKIFMFTSALVLEQGDVLGGFAGSRRWHPDENKRKLAQSAASVIAAIVLRASEGVKL